MKNDRIIASWDMILPDEAANERMRSKIMEYQRSYKNKGRVISMKKTTKKSDVHTSPHLSNPIIADVSQPTTKTTPKQPALPVRFHFPVSLVAVVACLAFAVGWVVLISRMNQNQFATPDESAEMILTQDESSLALITDNPDSTSLASDASQQNASSASTTAISGTKTSDKNTEQPETTLSETADASSDTTDTAALTQSASEEPNNAVAASESMRVTFDFTDLNGMPVQNLKVDLSPVDDIRFDYSPHFSPSDISGRSKGMAVPGHYTVIAQDTDETTVYNEMTFDLNVSAGQTEYHFVWEHLTPQERIASNGNSIRFVITDDGEPLANASIVLYVGHHEVHDFWTENPPESFELGSTDASGVVFWSAPRPGEYTLYTYVLEDGQRTKVAQQFVIDDITSEYTFNF